MNITEIKKAPLSGMLIPEIAAALNLVPELDKPAPYRAKQIFSWIKQGALSFTEMTNLPQAFIKTMEDHFVVRGSVVHKKHTGTDNTIKLVIKLSDGVFIETVLLPSASEKDLQKNGHFTACLSTQAGCPMGCVFCKTGSMGFFRNLNCSEIIEQFLFLNDELKENRISNIVIMGMGEPLLNLPALRKALEILCGKPGFGISKRKITISTAGIRNGIIDIAKNGPETELAISVASAREELRSVLMPGTVEYPLSELKEALIIFQETTGRQITVETVLLGGVNTGNEDAKALINFAKNLDAVINIIPWNPVSKLRFNNKKLQQPAANEIKNFIDMLKAGGLNVTQRYRRGSGISGACGQLGADTNG